MPTIPRGPLEGGQDADNAAVGVASSRFAAPSLRYGPSGDPTPPATRKYTMAVSTLPAMVGRRRYQESPSRR